MFPEPSEFDWYRRIEEREERERVGRLIWYSKRWGAEILKWPSVQKSLDVIQIVSIFGMVSVATVGAIRVLDWMF